MGKAIKGAFFHVAAVLILFAGIVQNEPALNTLAFFIYCIYIFSEIYAASIQPATAFYRADNVYFFGYLLTIIGVGGLAFQIGMNPVLIENPESVLKRAGVALASTVAGLLGMVLVRAYGTNNGPEIDKVGDEVRNQVEALQKAMRLFTNEIRSAQQEGITQLRNSVAEAARTIQTNLTESAAKFRDVLNQSAEKLRGLTESMNSLKINVPEMEADIQKFRAELKQLAEVFESNKASLEILTEKGGAIAKLTPGLRSTAQTIGLLAENTNDAAKAAKELSGCTKELETAISEFIKFTQRSVESRDGILRQSFPVQKPQRAKSPFAEPGTSSSTLKP